ncbi:MAG: VanW protein [Paenibacillaceae bacterium]|nr:VanW protein [Paenibacillaceae bacterium]
MFNRPKMNLWLMTALAIFAAAAAWSIRVYGLQQTVPNGVSFGGIAAGGLTYGQAQQLLEEKLRLAADIPIHYESDKPGADQTGTFGSAGLHWDASGPAKALRLLSEGSPYRRAIYRFQLAHSEMPLAVTYDEAAFAAFAGQTWAELAARQPITAKRRFSEQDQIEIIPDVAVYRVDEPELLRRLVQADWRAVWIRVAGESDSPPEAVKIALPLQEVRSPVTTEQLAAEGIERKISEFSTPILPGSEGRFHNIASAARMVQDRLLAPGEVFDYAPVVKETETRFGFREAPVIYNGKLVPGIGGGICQVSTTLYNAVLRAGLEIVERRNHSLPVSYVPLGQDATFSEGYINFRFRNNTDAYILIRTETAKDKLTVKLFGRLSPGITFQIESVTIEELAAPVKTVVNPKLKPGQRETLQKGKPGYVVETYRTKKENGTILSKELLSKDRYQPQPALVAVGGRSAGSDPAPGGNSGILEDGIEGPRFR